MKFKHVFQKDSSSYEEGELPHGKAFQLYTLYRDKDGQIKQVILERLNTMHLAFLNLLTTSANRPLQRTVIVSPSSENWRIN